MRPAGQFATALAAVLALAAATANAESYRGPRTPFGAPDLQGIWSNGSLTPLERSPSFKSLTIPDAEAAALEAGPPPQTTPADPFVAKARADELAVGTPQTEWTDRNRRYDRIDGQARTSRIVWPADGRLPYNPEGRRRAEAARQVGWRNYDGPEARQVDERCLLGTGSPSGPPILGAAYNTNHQIVQTADHVVILAEMNHEARIIRLAPTARLPPSIRPWMGDSVGWWDGDTLVVETTGFHPGESLRPTIMTLLYLSPQAKVTERFTRTAPDRILYQFAVEDPAIFTQTWRGEATFRATPGPIYEYACHEGNYSLPNILAGARAEEARARNVLTVTGGEAVAP